MADFGDPSTWEMNVDQFIDSGLPKEKPQELLDLQEQNRKQRLLQSLQKIGGGLEDSSLDFINRENFSEGNFGQNQFTKKLNKSLKDPEYIEKLVTRINLPEYADMSFKDLFREKVITNREMRELQKLGYKAQRQGKKFNDALAKARAEKRLELDPNRLKDKAKKLAGRNKKTVIHHGLPKRIPESLINLIVDKTGKTLFSEAEGVLQNLDAEKQKLLKDPTKNKKRINQIQAIEDRLKKGKTIPEVTSISTRTNKPITKTNVSLNPEQKGLYGYENFDIDKKGNLTKKLKGVDLSQTIAGLSDDLLNKVDFRNASPEDQEKIVKKMASKIKGKIVSDKDSKNIAKQLESFGFKCNLANGTSCNNPMAYLDDIKKQQTIAKGSGNAAANAVKKLSAGKTIMREFIGPAALTFELAAAIPITYLGYKAGLPPARIVADATYGLFGETEKARLKKEAVKAGIDTSEIQKSLDFEKASGAMQSLVQQEGEFRGPDDEMQFPQQYEKGEEDFYKAVGGFRDEEGNVSKDVYQKFGSQLKGLRDYIAKTDAATAAERFTGPGTYEATPEEIDASFDMQDGIMAAKGGRINFKA